MGALRRLHKVANAAEASADAASGMQVGEVFGLPSAAAAYFEGERITQR